MKPIQSFKAEPKSLVFFFQPNFYFSGTIHDSLLESIMISLEKRGPVPCALIIKDKSFEEDFNLDIPHIILNLDEDLNVKYSSQYCKNHVLFIKDSDSINSINHKDLILNYGKYAIVFLRSQSIEDIKRMLLDDQNFLQKISDLAIFNPHQDGFLIFTRNENDERKMKLQNRWYNGKYLMSQEIFPSDRLKNLHSKTLRATSFIYAPFVYQDTVTKIYQGYEVSFVISYCLVHINESKVLHKTEVFFFF